MFVKCVIDDQTVIRAFTQLANLDVTNACKDSLTEAADLVVNAFRSTVPRSNVDHHHLADALGVRIRAYRNRSGAYCIIGARLVGGKMWVKHFHATESGTIVRVRKRIGGRYAWVEGIIANLSTTQKDFYRRTEDVQGQHFLQRAFESQRSAMLQIIKVMFQQRILQKWTDKAL